MFAPYRIKKSGVAGAPTPPADGYFDRLMKLIPTEVVAVYLAGIGMIPADISPIPQNLRNHVLLSWAALCLIFVFVSRVYGTRDKAGSNTDWKHVVISLISFIIWVYTMGDVPAGYNVYVPWLGSIVVLIWTFIVPYIYKGP